MRDCHRWRIKPSQIRRGAAVLPVFLAVLGCSSTEGPRSGGVRLFVTNLNCLVGKCPPLEVLGFPDNQPATPGGAWSIDLGDFEAPAACLTLPDSAVFLVIGINQSAGTADTVRITWTTAMPLALGALPPGGNRIMAGPSTSSFTPAAAPGWEITFPGGTQVAPAQPCAP